MSNDLHALCTHKQPRKHSHAHIRKYTHTDTHIAPTQIDRPTHARSLSPPPFLSPVRSLFSPLVPSLNLYRARTRSLSPHTHALTHKHPYSHPSPAHTHMHTVGKAKKAWWEKSSKEKDPAPIWDLWDQTPRLQLNTAESHARDEELGFWRNQAILAHARAQCAWRSLDAQYAGMRESLSDTGARTARTPFDYIGTSRPHGGGGGGFPPRPPHPPKWGGTPPLP